MQALHRQGLAIAASVALASGGAVAATTATQWRRHLCLRSAGPDPHALPWVRSYRPVPLRDLESEPSPPRR